VIRARITRRTFLEAAGAAAVTVAAGRRPLLAAPRSMADVVVLLPGITGSVLRKDGRDLWALSGRGVTDALRTFGRNLDALLLKDDPPDVDDLGDGVTAGALFPDVHLVPGLWKIDGYTTVAQRLAHEFDLRPGENFFEFPYDWRRDNRVAARRLARASAGWLRAWRGAGHEGAKLVVVAHSMGGLVARYFLECLGGWRDTRRLVTFGTPYRGSLNALGFLANGFRKTIAGLSLVDLTHLLRSFTSVYQLLPIYPCCRVGDGPLVRVGETTGIPGVDAARAAAALAFHREIERAVAANRGDERYLREGYALHPIVGTYQTTFQSAVLVDGAVRLETTYPGRDEDGDGTVPRASATPIELTGLGRETFVAEVHGSLQNADAALVQVCGLLSPAPPVILRGPARPALGLEVDDAYAATEPIRLRGRCEDEAAALSAVVTDVRTGGAVARVDLRRNADGVHEAACGPLPEGTYRATVTNRTAGGSVSDVFVVSA
jgi:hypothetical protein